MKEWQKPEIVDLDVKYTENVPVTISGGGCDKGWRGAGYVNINGKECREYVCNCGGKFYTREDAEAHQPLPFWIPFSN